MKKKKIGRKFSRKTDQRKALIRSLLSSLFLRGKIKTTEAKAKEISRFADNFINKSKNNDLATIRNLARYFSRGITKKLVQEIGPGFKERKGGYTRVVKTGQRKSDGARMAIIEIVK